MVTESKAMELKKSSAVEADSFSLSKVSEFVQDVKAEVKKITWTSRDELSFYTKLVVGATVVVGMSIYVLDLVIQISFFMLNFLSHLITY